MTERIITPQEQEEEAPVQAGAAAQLQVAHVLLLLVLLAAGVMRFSSLGAVPLSPQEAEQALAVWQIWQPETAVPVAPAVSSYSPAYFSLTSPLMLLFGDSDAVMRLVPALFGIALVFLPWLWRKRLGLLGALTTSALLAASPSFSLLSRTVGGGAIALFAALLLLIAWVRYRESNQAVWLYTAFVALALGLVSAPLFYSGLLALALAWLAQATLGPPLLATARRLFSSPDGQEEGGPTLRRAALLGSALFLVLATFFFWHLPGLGAAASLLGRWVADFSLSGDVQSWLAPILAFGRYELLAVLLGIPAILWVTWRGYAFPVFLVYWFTGSLLLVLLQRGVLANVPLLALPLYLLIGWTLDRAFSLPAGRVRWGVFLLVLVAGAIFYFNGARYVRLADFSANQFSFALMAIIALALAAVVVNYVRSWDAGAALQGTLLGVLALLLLYTWGSAWWLTHEAANDPRAGYLQRGADGDVFLLVQMLEEVSQQATGTRNEVPILASVDSPLLRWYLRDFRQVVIGNTIPPGTNQEVVITPATAEPQLGNDYFGLDLGLTQSTDLTAATDDTNPLIVALRWWLFHETSRTLARESIILWVRNDALQ